MPRRLRLEDDDKDLSTLVNINSGKVTVAKMLTLDELEQTEHFKNLLPQSQTRIDNLASEMRDRGFDPAFPLYVWTYTDSDGKIHHVIIDGNTRYAAARQAQIFSVPVCECEFSDEKEATKTALTFQLDRRNLSPLEMIDLIDKYLEFGGKIKMKELKKELQEKFNVSERQVAKMIAISENEEAKEAVANGQTVAQAYEELMDRKNPERKQKKDDEFEYEDEPDDDLTSDYGDDDEETEEDDYETESCDLGNFDSADDESGNEDLQDDEETGSRGDRKETKAADKPASDNSWNYAEAETKEREYAKGFETGFCFAIASIKQGKDADEIFSYFSETDSFSFLNLKGIKLSEEQKRIIAGLKAKSSV